MKGSLFGLIQERYRLTAIEWALVACLISILAVGALDLIDLIGVT